MKRLPQGLSEYVQVVFDEQYFSSMSVVVQATLLDFRFRLKTFKSIQDELALFDERRLNSSEKRKRKSSMLLKRKNNLNDQVPLEPILPPPFVPQTIAEFIFADEDGHMPEQLDLQEVDQIYNDYIRVMTCMHERLRSVYNTFVTKFFDEKLRKEHGL
jgi:hypothetical protein